MKNKFFNVVVAVLFFLHAVEARPAKFSPPKVTASNKSKLSVADLTRNVEFAFCKANVPLIDSIQLNELAKFLMDNRYAISLRGHADAIGSYVGNWKMSEARANAVKAYLVQKGVVEGRIVTTAFGSTIPIANNKTSKGRQKNRRVEIRLKQIGA